MLLPDDPTLAKQMMGYERAEVVGQDHALFVHHEYAGTDKYEEFLAEMLSGELRSNIVRRFRKDGSAMWMQGTFCPV